MLSVPNRSAAEVLAIPYKKIRRYENWQWLI